MAGDVKLFLREAFETVTFPHIENNWEGSKCTLGRKSAEVVGVYEIVEAVAEALRKI